MGAPPDVIAEHAGECILLWPLREVALLQPNVDLDVLERMDARLEAHLDGLRLAGPDGFDAILGAAAKETGAAWATTILAAESDRLAELPPAACLAEAVSWMDGASATRALAAWRTTARHLALEAAGHLGLSAEIGAGDPASGDPAIAAAACTAAARCGARGHATAIRKRLDDADPLVALAAARFAALALGDAAAAKRLLAAQGLADRILGARCATPEPGATGRRGALLASAAGEAARIPWLIERMREAPHARAAGEGFTTITGCDLTTQGLAAAAPPAGTTIVPSEDPAAEDVALDEDEHLPWPDADAVAAWWKSRAGAFPAGRLLAGSPVSEARTVLATGTQRQRLAAAVELARAGAPLFPWTAPAVRQRVALAGVRP